MGNEYLRLTGGVIKESPYSLYSKDREMHTIAAVLFIPLFVIDVYVLWIIYEVLFGYIYI